MRRNMLIAIESQMKTLFEQSKQNKQRLYLNSALFKNRVSLSKEIPYHPQIKFIYISRGGLRIKIYIRPLKKYYIHINKHVHTKKIFFQKNPI